MFKRKPTKTISGVAPLAVMAMPRACTHGTCIYCPSLNAPQSYTPESPAVLRAASLKYDPFKQVHARLKAFKIMGHPTDKIELIVMGGTFLSYPLNYQYNFIKRCYDALNGKKAGNFEEAKKLNERAKHRCVALCIETRPDVCGKIEIARMLDFGATRCELGVQALDNKIYRKIERGHTVADVINATKLLKDAGFKVGYHVMPGLPGSSIKQDIKLFKRLFSEPFRPDQLKIYPTQVLKGSKLAEIHEQGKYSPYSEEELVKLIAALKQLVPPYCRIMRIMREIPPSYLVSGTKRIDLRKVIAEYMKKQGMQCKCIRCREVGFAAREGKEIKKDLMVVRHEYKASGGKEFFLSFVNSDNLLFGLCRLRITKDKIALIRELHVYGPQIELGKHAGGWQHQGLGMELMQEAEKIAKDSGCMKMKVISGIGVREYYKKLGYNLEEEYMTKNL